IAPSMVAIITAPASDNDAAGRWLVSRALDVTTRLVPVASPEIAKALQALVIDQARSTDERVRAAIALGRTADSTSGIDAAAAVLAIRGLAAAALEDSLSAAKDRALAASLSGIPLTTMQTMGPETGGSGVAYPMDKLQVERDAWRLMKLSEAVARPKLKKDKSGILKPAWNEPLDGGLARLLEGEATSAAVDFATRIRDAADALVKTPTAAAVREAHETIVTWSPAGT
ncbi:MAG: hypothetical protein ACKO4T_14910, partial [Planctomycetaceae bacterium]